MLEELQWMGAGALTCDQLRAAVRAEMRRPRPRIQRVAENVYWFMDRDIPLGWSLYRDRRMLPCFYRVYPPAISWDDLDRPENILPPPGTEQHSAPPPPPPNPAPPVLSSFFGRRRLSQFLS